ncbi:MAG TPA: hypothetical protein VK524_20045, partial [Polyangiaceae bacterium]|nr:hypothetical protein [Polyangiaceae bacterium]
DFELRGTHIRVFDAPLTLAHLAAHFAQHGFAELRILRQLARAWNSWSDAHAAALALADSIAVGPALDYALSAAAHFGWLVPPPPPRDLSWRARQLLRLLPLHGLTDDPALERSYTRQLLLLLIADPRVLARSIAQRFFPPLDELASTYRKPIGRTLYARYPSYWLRPLIRLVRGIPTS